MPLLDVRLPPGGASLLSALRALLRAAGDPRDTATIHGLSGLAFRLTVSPCVDLSGPTAFPWDHELRAALSRLGYDGDVHYAEPDDPRWPRLKERAIAAACHAIDAGRPVLAFGVQVPAFGLLRGYDAARRLFLVSGLLDGAGAAMEMSFDALGEGDVPVLCVVALGERTDASPEIERRALDAALRAGLVHARGQSVVRGGYASGLAAWGAIDGALATLNLDPVGLAYTIALVSEGRAHVAELLAGEVESGRTPALAAAASAYRALAAKLAALASHLPFPPPPDSMITVPRRDDLRTRVQAIATAEGLAAQALAAYLDGAAISRRSAGLRLADLTASDGDRLFSCIREIPIAGLATAGDECRPRAAPRLGVDFFAKVLLDDQAPEGMPSVGGHVYYAPLEAARYPVRAAGRHLFLFCAWLRRDLRGIGLGRRVLDAVLDEARAGGYEGVLTIATSQEVFLHYSAFLHLGWVEADREEDDRLLYLPLTRSRLDAAPRYLAISPAIGAPGSVGVRVRQGHNCPLLFAARAAVAGAAATLLDQVKLDASDATPSERPEDVVQATIGGRRLPLGYVPERAIVRYLSERPLG